MESCLDFANELTQLEYVAQELDSSILITTKYHAELAGEGCEYTWGVAKSRFRRIKMSEKLNKKSKEYFVANVKKCLSTEKVLRPYNIGRFSRRARSYVFLYYALNKQQRQEYSDISENQDAAIVPTECKDFHSIQKMVKTFQTHWNIVDLETGYINRVMRGEEIK